jgi:hypothetical protein
MARTEYVKRYFIRNWPERFSSTIPAAPWIRCQPPVKGAAGRFPRLWRPGASLGSAQPDALYARLFYGESSYCDCVAFEACGSHQSFHRSRSRYAPSTQSYLLECGPGWMNDSLKGGKERRHYIAGLGKKKPELALRFAVRHLQVCFLIPGRKEFQYYYDQVCPMGHEFFMPIDSVRAVDGKVRRFIDSMAFETHFFRG